MTINNAPVCPPEGHSPTRRERQRLHSRIPGRSLRCLFFSRNRLRPLRSGFPCLGSNPLRRVPSCRRRTAESRTAEAQVRSSQAPRGGRERTARLWRWSGWALRTSGLASGSGRVRSASGSDHVCEPRGSPESRGPSGAPSPPASARGHRRGLPADSVSTGWLL